MSDYSDSIAIIVGIVLAGIVSFIAWTLFFGDFNRERAILRLTARDDVHVGRIGSREIATAIAVDGGATPGVY